MSILAYLPAVLATIGIALRFWQSREAAPVIRAATPQDGYVTGRPVKKAAVLQCEMVGA
ncbi:hypothetical protein GJ700_02310 [Duganella sp. FT92W]|uniref:Uncharacterized protein n=1 Tax=Pseudoduganella rivuli TaxID=2666085 RepID=A0A7X2IJ86_9BURK|nr:hypothetical protein [Pseudoduganella rivuli]MRV70552.1 hypothetical protein [Pseudoduganella rivuli]